jgi:hypothetical protein
MRSAPRDAAARATRNAVLVAGAIALVLAALPPLFGAHWFGRDLWWVDAGVLCELRRALADDAGLALAPHLGRSSPLFANPHAQLLYPLRWPALLLSPDAGVSWHVVVHLCGAAAAAAWLARTFGARPVAAIATGVAFAACGTVVDLISHSLYLVSAAWLPASWAAARAALRARARPRDVALVALFLALVLLGGDAQGFAMAGGVVLLECALLALRAPRRRAAALRVALALPTAALVGAAQLLPTLAEASASGRLGGDVDVALTWSLTLPGVIALVLPIELGANVGGGASFASALGVSSTWNVFPHLGALTLASALSLALARRTRTLSITAAGALVFALGSAGLVYPLVLRVVPLLSSLRYPEKYLLPASLAVVVLAGLALDRAARRRSASFASALSVAGIGLLVLVLLASAAPGLFPDEAPRFAAVVRSGALTALGPVALALVLARAGRLRAALPFALPVALAIPALGHVNAGPSPLELPWVHADALPDDAVVCRDRRLFQSAVAQRGGEQTSWNQHVAGFVYGVGEQSACHGFISGVAYSPLRAWPEALLEAGISTDADGAARALGCTHVLGVPTGADGSSARKPPLVEVSDPAPPAFVVPSAALGGDDELARALAAPELGTFGVVDDPRGALGGRALPAGTSARADELVARAPADLSVLLSGDGGAVVAVRRSYRAGWSARQAGAELPVVRVGGTLLGVVVEDVSRGNVELNYAPPRLTAGAALSLLGLVLAGLGALWARRRP